tara:strand:- start:25 stop:495 length:471 start_codon:yes stop_codon:yes gene_type:complete
MKYRRLSKEQFEELHKEFINFLATQSITVSEWKLLKEKKPEVAEAELDVFSDLVWEGVLENVTFLENINPKHMYLFCVKEKSIALIGLKVSKETVDLTTEGGFSWLRDNLMSSEVEIFDAEKQLNGDKKLQIFELIEKGAHITKGELFKYFEQLIG